MESVWSVCMCGVSVYGACAYGVQNKYNNLVIHPALDDFSTELAFTGLTPCATTARQLGNRAL